MDIKRNIYMCQTEGKTFLTLCFILSLSLECYRFWTSQTATGLLCPPSDVVVVLRVNPLPGPWILPSSLLLSLLVL